MNKEDKIAIFINEALCKGVDGCGLCIHICPKKIYRRAETLTEKGVRPPEITDSTVCTGCQLCVMYCPDFAIVVDKSAESV